MKGADADSAVALWRDEQGDGATKLLVVRQALAVRRARPECFGPGLNGGCHRLDVSGPGRTHVAGFRRGAVGGGGVIALGTRLPVGLDAAGGWHHTELILPAGTWVGQFAEDTFQGSVPVARLLGEFPVALLITQGMEE